jgi:hypothetical protein
MKLKLFELSVLLMLVLSITGLKAQTNTNASGGIASGSGGSISYSIGQLVYTTSFGSNGSVAEGVQQAYEISVVTANNLAKEINLVVVAYPNPTSDYLSLSIDASTMFSIQSMSYQLYDMNGKLLRSEKIISSQTTIDMSNLVSASYYVQVKQEKTELKTFKIIKN